MRCFKPKCPSQEEITKMIVDNQQSFEIAYNYLLKKPYNEHGAFSYDKNTLKSDKANMTDEEFKALSDVLNNPIISYYCRRPSDGMVDIENGVFSIETYDDDVKFNIGFITNEQYKSNYIHLTGNWYMSTFYPH